MLSVIRVIVGAAALLAVAGCGNTQTSKPAHRHLVYLAGDDPSVANVEIADPNGAHPRSIGRGSAAVLSPDGGTVAVRRRDGIYLVSANGRRVRKLTSRRLSRRRGHRTARRSSRRGRSRSRSSS
jgi:hypothetical protein